MTEYRPPLDDIFFTLDHLVDLDELCQLDPFQELDPDTIRGVIEEYGRFMSEVIAPLNQPGDLEGSVHHPEDNSVSTPEGFKDAYDQYVKAQWSGVPFPVEYDGGGFPWLVGIVFQEIIDAANLSFSMAPLLTHGAIDMLLEHGSEEQKERYLRPMVTGRWTGTMNLTEPQAGSDVGSLSTRAVRQDDGSYRITGQKIFISFGDHDLAENIVHLVLARTPDAPPGTKGISCFIVPKYLVNDDGTLGERNDVTCLSVEHKMGIKASPTCVMAYGDQGDGAVGFLIGEEQQGMRYMFTMMNNARISVGVEGLGVAERAYQAAVDYAKERQQGRAVGAAKGVQSPIVEHPDVRRMLMTMKSYVEAMRALVYVTSEAVDLARHHIDPQIREVKADQVELLTPIVKAFCTDMGNEVASLAVQVHGGVGYVEETGVAQYFRDARITPIYEGTNGIQAMDLVGRKLPLKGGAVVRDFLAMMAALDPALVRAGDELLAIKLAYSDSLQTLIEATTWFFETGIKDPTDALGAATPYARLFGLVVGGWLLARGALAAHHDLKEGVTEDEAKLRARISTARFYAENILPASRGLLQPVKSASRDLFTIAVDEL